MTVLGCIADDFTGATDLANNLVRAGMRVVLTVDVPTQAEAIDADAVVVALKSRTEPPAKAVEQSLHACRWLRRQGARQRQENPSFHERIINPGTRSGHISVRPCYP